MMLIVKINIEKYQVLRSHSHFSHQNVFKKYTIPKYSLNTSVKDIVPMYHHISLLKTLIILKLKFYY